MIRRVKIAEEPRPRVRQSRFAATGDREPTLSNSRAHFIVSVDVETMRGICATCGEVDIARRNLGGRKGSITYQCRTRMQEAKKRANRNRLARAREQLINEGKTGEPSACTCTYRQADPNCRFDQRLTPDPSASHPGYCTSPPLADR